MMATSSSAKPLPSVLANTAAATATTMSSAVRSGRLAESVEKTRDTFTKLFPAFAAQSTEGQHLVRIHAQLLDRAGHALRTFRFGELIDFGQHEEGWQSAGSKVVHHLQIIVRWSVAYI